MLLLQQVFQGARRAFRMWAQCFAATPQAQRHRRMLQFRQADARPLNMVEAQPRVQRRPIQPGFAAPRQYKTPVEFARRAQRIYPALVAAHFPIAIGDAYRRILPRAA